MSNKNEGNQNDTSFNSYNNDKPQADKKDILPNTRQDRHDRLDRHLRSTKMMNIPYKFTDLVIIPQNEYNHPNNIIEVIILFNLY